MYEMDGYSIDIPHFYCMDYHENNRKMTVEMDFREMYFELAPDIITHWDSPYDKETLGREEKERILLNIKRFLLEKMSPAEIYEEGYNGDLMVTMPDGIKIEMQWKQITYIKKQDRVLFEIVPMLKGKDIVVFPDKKAWAEKQDVFSEEDREEIIFLIERIAWKRELSIMEMDVAPFVNEKLEVRKGMIESTNGYSVLSERELFDPTCSLEKEQVREIYCRLEKKYAESASGLVRVPSELLIDGSVLKEVTIPALRENSKVKIEII